MTTEQFKRERCYSAALALTKSLMANNLITPTEYKEIRRRFVQKYQPILGEL